MRMRQDVYFVEPGATNVRFIVDVLPEVLTGEGNGAQGQLAANMPNSLAPLEAPYQINPNAAYTMSFAGVPAGVYNYYCTPHLALGMIAKITGEK